MRTIGRGVPETGRKAAMLPGGRNSSPRDFPVQGVPHEGAYRPFRGGGAEICNQAPPGSVLLKEKTGGGIRRGGRRASYRCCRGGPRKRSCNDPRWSRGRRSGEAGGDGLNVAGEISIDSEKWRESFRREFDKGLERWNRAEESLLEARVRWERDTNAGFRRTEEAWADAYRELTDARSRWEQEIYSVLEDGRRRWEEKEAELVSAVDDARKELEGAIEERAGSLKSRVKNLVEIILQSRETMRTAKESAEYWEERIETAGAGDGTAGRELAFWQSVYDESAGYAETAAAELAGTYGEVVNGGALKHHFLDDYQVELLKASALEEYWERELEISRAVYEYAVDKSSGRSTEAETRLEYEEAFSLYKEKKEAYGAAVAELKEKGMALEEGRDKLDELRSRLAEAGSELEEAREEYTLAMDLFTTGNDDYFGGKIDEYERRLRELRGTGEEVSGGGSEETAGVKPSECPKRFLCGGGTSGTCRA